MLSTMFQVNWPFRSGEEGKNRLLRWQSWRSSLIFNWNDFSYFWSTKPDAFYQLLSQLAFMFIRSNKSIFKMATMAAPWISDLKNFSCFDLQVTPMLPTNRPLG